MQEYPKWVTDPKTKERKLVQDEAQEEQVLGKKKSVVAPQEEHEDGEKKPSEKPKK